MREKDIYVPFRNSMRELLDRSKCSNEMIATYIICVTLSNQPRQTDIIYLPVGVRSLQNSE